MSSSIAYTCNGCGSTIDDVGVAHTFAGILQNQSTVAAGGEHAWHSCSAKCAAAYLRQLANAIEARGEQLRQPQR